LETILCETLIGEYLFEQPASLVVFIWL